MKKLIVAGRYYREILRISIPVAASQAGHIIVGITDSIMVGNIGSEGSELGKLSLAAASLANGVFSIIMVMGLGIAYGITPAVANVFGQKNTGELSKLLKHGIIISLMSALVLCGIFIPSSSAFGLLGQEADVIALTIPYFNILMLSLVPLMGFMALKQFNEGLSATRHATIISLSCNVLNIFFNYVLIYGNFGFPELGLSGAGWATFLSRTLMAVMMIIVMYRNRFFIQYIKGFNLKNISGQLTMRLFKSGLPVGLQMAFEVTTFALAAVMMGWLGTTELAAHQIALSLAAVTYMIASGISAAATVKTGHYYGASDITGLVNSAKAAFHIVTAFMVMSGVVFIVFRNLLPPFFNYETGVIELASVLLIVAALFQVSDGLQVVAIGVLRGFSDFNYPTLISFVSYSVAGLPVGYVLSFIFDFGAIGIWSGLLIGLTLSASLQILRLKKLISRRLNVNEIVPDNL